MSKGDIVLGVQFQGDVSELNRQISNIGKLTRDELVALNQQLGGEVVKKLVIRTEVDGSGVKKQVAEYKDFLTVVDQLVNKQNQLNKIEPGSVTSLRQQVNTAKQARDEIAKYEKGIGVLGNTVNIVSDRWTAQNQRVQELQRSLDLASASTFWSRAKTGLNIGGAIDFANNLTQITNGLQAVSIIIGQVTASVNGLINALGDIQAFKLSFEAIGQGAGGAAIALAKSSEISKGLGVDLKTVRGSFQQLSPVITSAGGTIGDVSTVVESLSSRFAAFGISGDKARRVTNGVIQAFAKGKLMAEELTQQISEADPAFRTDFANALGYTTSQLEQLVKQGKITTEFLLKGLAGIGKSSLVFGRLGVSAVDAANSLATSGTTVDQVRAKLDTINQLSLERLAKSIEPVLFAFIKFGAVVTDSLDRLSKNEGIKSLGSALGGVVSSLADVAELFFRMGEAILVPLGAVAQLVNALIQIPGVTQLVAFAITAKMLSPLAALSKRFAASELAATGWGRTIAALTSFDGLSNGLTSLTQKVETNREKIRNLRKENLEYSKSSANAARSVGLLQGAIDKNEKKISYLTNPGVKMSTGGGNEQYIKSLENKSSKLRGIIETLNNVIATNDAKLAGNSAQLKSLSGSSSLATGATRVFGSALGAAKGLAAGFAEALGPVGVALLAVSVLTSAYSNASKKSNEILEQSKQKVDALQQSTKDLGGSVLGQEQPLTGLALAWEDYAFRVKEAIDTISDPAKIMENPVEASLKNIAASSPLIAGLRGIYVQFNQEATNAEIKTEKLGLAMNATTESASNQANAIIGLVNAAAKIKPKTDGTIDLKVVVAKGQIEDAVNELEKTLKNLQAEREGLAVKLSVAPKGTTEYTETAKQIGILDAAIKKVTTSYNTAKKGSDDLATANGWLTTKQKEVIPTVEKLSQDLKAQQDIQIKDINPNVNQEAWAAATRAIIDTRNSIDQLNAKGAVVSIKVIEEGGTGGVRGTLNSLDFYIEQLNLKKVSIPIGSGDISEVIAQINYVNELRNAGNRTTGDLERQIITANNELRLSSIKKEQDARNAYYDAEIAKLQELGPAEQALQNQRRAELRERAAAGDLEAAAQLERIGREEKILAIRKEQDAANLKTAQQVKEIEAQQADIIKAGKDLELKAIQEVLTARLSGIKLITEAAIENAKAATGIVATAGEFADQMAAAAKSAGTISTSLTSLDGKTITLNVVSIPQRWAGGPTTAGQTYQVNELGQEGFLSAGGHLSSINKPKNALWRAPSSGTVIPAHIWAGLDVPSGGVTTNVRPMPTGSSNGGLQKLARAIQSSLSRSSGSSESMHEMAAVQARQAIEIGKLSRAVNRLADKDQTVNVAVRNTGTTAYLEAMNRRM